MARSTETLTTSSRFETDASGADCGLAWYVVRTNPRCERRAEASVAEAGFRTYAPLFRKLIVHHRSKRVVSRDFPLLTGYVFVQLDRQSPPFGFVRECDGVQKFLEINGRPSSISDELITMVREIEGAEWLHVDVSLRQSGGVPKTHRKGMSRVDFIGGPFTGLMGYTADAKARGLVRVVTNAFGKLTEVNVPVDDLCAAA